MNVKRTSDMLYPLEAPNGWFLRMAKHEHDQELNHYVPAQVAGGPWLVEFRKPVIDSKDDVNIVFGRGHSLEQAWANAKVRAEEVDAKER